MSKSTSHLTPLDNNDKPLKIGIIAHSLHPIAQPFAGGLEMITQLLCNELTDLGHEVTLFAHPESQTQAKLRPFMSPSQFEALLYPNEHESLGMSRDELYQYVLYQDAMREIIAATQDGAYHIIHNHSLHHVPMLTGQALGSRLLTTFHTPIFAHLRLALLTLQHGTAIQFTSISQFQQRLYSEFVPSKVVYNGIDVRSFEANVAAVSDEVYFWFGRICPEKGTHLAMQYCIAANKKLIIAGPKSNMAYYDKQVAPLLKQDALEANGNGLLTYVGHLTKPQINDYLKQATATLFTSTWDEPYGLTLAESLACGTPIIGFDVGAGAEIVTEATGFIVPKLDQTKFIAAFAGIQQISREACRERAEQFCSVKAMVEGYMALYRDMLASIEQNSDLVDGNALHGNALNHEPNSQHGAI